VTALGDLINHARGDRDWLLFAHGDPVLASRLRAFSELPLRRMPAPDVIRMIAGACHPSSEDRMDAVLSVLNACATDLGITPARSPQENPDA
jgi:hypothetical protein